MKFPFGCEVTGVSPNGSALQLVVVAQVGWGTCVCALCTYTYIALPRLYSYESLENDYGN